MSFIEEYDRLVEVGRMYMRGRSPKEIAEHFNVSTRQINKDIAEWNELNNKLMRESGTFAEQMTDIIAEVDQHWRMIIREAWEIQEDAKADMNRKDQLAALKMVADIEKNRAVVFGDAARAQDAELISELEETRWQVDQVQKLLKRIADEHPNVAQLIYESLSLISKQAIEIEATVVSDTDDDDDGIEDVLV